jgi:hypothetical protein
MGENGMHRAVPLWGCDPVRFFPQPSSYSRGAQMGADFGRASGFSKAEEIARRQLRKLVKDDSLWSVSEFQIVRCPKAAESRWFYAIVFAPVIELRGEKSDTATILVTMGGKVASVRPYNVANVAGER